MIRLELAIVCVFMLVFIWSCDGNEPPRRQYYEPEQEAKPYPGAEVQKAKELMDEGLTLFSDATNADLQEEKDRLARESLDRYYYPAQAILDRLRREYPEHVSSIDALYQELNRRILDANRIIGTGG